MGKKFYLDFEFIEGFRRWIWWLPSWLWFNRPYWHIEIISIGIWSEDGEGYYAINKNFNPRWANEWVKKNVIAKLPPRTLEPEKVEGNEGDDSGYPNSVIYYTPDNPLYKTLKEIKCDIVEFICPYEKASEYAGVGSLESGLEGYLQMNPPKFYGYYSDYDWVCFCTIFGTMMDLPKGMPMYCIDLKQMLDDRLERNSWNSNLTGNTELADVRPATLKEKLAYIKTLGLYPKQENEHRADDDAFFNWQLHQFIMNTKL